MSNKCKKYNPYFKTLAALKNKPLLILLNDLIVYPTMNVPIKPLTI